MTGLTPTSVSTSHEPAYVLVSIYVLVPTIVPKFVHVPASVLVVF